MVSSCYYFFSPLGAIELMCVYCAQIDIYASIVFMALFASIAAIGILEMHWGGVGIDDWWRNEQFWVIGGVSSHLFALFQGLLKVLAGVDTNFTVTSKGGDDGDFLELYLFKWTSLLIPLMTLGKNCCCRCSFVAIRCNLVVVSFWNNCLSVYFHILMTWFISGLPWGLCL